MQKIRIGTMLLMAALSLALASASAHAQQRTSANYSMHALEYAPGSPILNCRGWSGGSDDAGHFYIPCPGPQVPYVYEFDENGTYLRAATLPAGYLFDATYRMRDVAVTPDGRTMYVNTGPIVDDLGYNIERPNGGVAGAILKFNRQLNGSWQHDAAWRSGPFLLNGRYWAPRYLDVDASGRLYAGVNAYVYEIDPANGARMGFFGGVETAYPGGPWLDGIDVALGMSVARDGSSMLLVEQRHNIVQRWVRSATGWQRDRTWGPNGNGLIGEPSRVDASYCYRDDRLQSPYDIGRDIAGDIYVVDTSCHRIQRFSDNGAHIQTPWSNDLADEMVHGFVVNTRGSIIVPELETKLIRTDPARPPCVDAAGPSVTSVDVVARSARREITLRAGGVDDCSGVNAIRVSGDVLGTPVWHDGTTASVQLAGWNGAKRLTIELRDSTGKVGPAHAVRTTLAMPQPRLKARVKTPFRRAKGCASTDPRRVLASPGRYRIVARCARVVGTVTRVRGRGRSAQIEVTLGTATARAVYANAVGPVRILAITDRRTRLRRAPRVGQRVVLVAPLVAPRTLNGVYAVPLAALR